MSKKFILAFIILFGLMFFLSPAECLAGATELLDQAQNYKNTGNRQLAELVYNTVATTYPATGYGLTAKSEITIMSISAQTDSQIPAEIDSLKAEFSALPELPAVLCNIAAGYAWAGRYQQGGDLYQQIIQDYPAGSAVAKAQIGNSRMNILSLIKSGDYAAAEAEVDNLVNSYSGSEYLPAALYHIARRYQWSRQYDQAKDIHQQIIRQFPDSDEADRARLDMGRIDVLSLIKSGDYAAAEAQIGQMLQQFPGHPSLPAVFYSIAMEYEAKDKYEQARNLNQQITQYWPESSYVARARFNFAKTTVLSLIQSSDYTAGGAELDKFGADFSSNPDFTKAMFAVGGQYYIQACRMEDEDQAGQSAQLYQNAITAWGLPREQSQSYKSGRYAWYLSGRCHKKLGDYENAIECCEKVVADWPECKWACDAQFTVGHCYEKMAKEGVMSKSEAEPKIRAAYQSLVENYPGCDASRPAQDWLNRHSTEF